MSRLRQSFRSFLISTCTAPCSSKSRKIATWLSLWGKLFPNAPMVWILIRMVWNFEVLCLQVSKVSYLLFQTNRIDDDCSICICLHSACNKVAISWTSETRRKSGGRLFAPGFSALSSIPLIHVLVLVRARMSSLIKPLTAARAAGLVHTRPTDKNQRCW